MSDIASETEQVTFTDLGLNPEILRALDEAGYTHPTPIQAQAIPHVLMGRDVLGLAQTGTGKTASFTLPMIEILSTGRAKARMPRSIILEPTRELATQVAENFEKYGKHHPLNYALLIGGTSMDEQIKALDRGVDVLIATPGRMLDLIDRGRILLADVKILVIDEADRMLDMGFIPDIETIVQKLPVIRQTLLFSATMPAEIRSLVDRFMMNPREVAVAPPATTASTVAQHLAIAEADDKREVLRRIIRLEEVKNAFIFCNRKRDVTIVFRSLTKHGFDAGQLHGDMVQSARTETLEQFKRGEIRLLVCSDVAARGIDVSDLSHVFNFDVPFNSDDYVHRIGRTGRAGKTGRAFTLATPEDGLLLKPILERLSEPPELVQIEDLTMGLSDLDESPRGKRRRRGGGSGARKGSDAKRSESRFRPERSPEPKKTPDPVDEIVAEEAPSPRRERGPRQDRTNRRSPRGDRGRHRDDWDDEPVVGMGDHVPAFLLRPSRRTPDQDAA